MAHQGDYSQGETTSVRSGMGSDGDSDIGSGMGSGMDKDTAQTADQILQTVTQDLKELQQGLVSQLVQEVTQLQAEKARLSADVEQLRSQWAVFQTQRLDALSEQQLAQQQIWAKQLAQVLANHLQTLMMQRLNDLANPAQPGASPLPYANGHSETAQRLLGSLDATFSSTFKTLQEELNSYQSSLSQQLNRMHSLEQQGEAILEALITHLRDQLQAETGRRSTGTNLLDQPSAPLERLPEGSQTSDRESTIAQPTPLAVPASPLPLPKEPKPPADSPSQFQLGLSLVLLSTVALSVHNVVVRIIGSKSSLLGLVDLGGFIKLGLGNSLLILWLRMLVVLPLMVPVAMVLYPAVWSDIKKFLTTPDRRGVFTVVGSGAFLFLSQILIYISIGQIGPGAAVTILFMYPIVTVPLAWLLFRDRPSTLRWIVMAVIFAGVVLTALPNINPSKIMSGTGVLAAIVAGIAFAFYIIFMQIGFKKLHPVPVSLVQFFTIFVLSSIILILPLDLGVSVAQPSGFLVGGIILGVLTLVGYLANNFGVRFMGAAKASIISSSGPVLTALLAFLLINSPLQWVQWLGILLVTGGVTALSFERMKKN